MKLNGAWVWSGVLVLAAPAVSLARLGEPQPFPALTGVLNPAPHYFHVVLPLWLLSLPVLFVAYRASGFTRGTVGFGRLLWLAILTLLSGSLLFAVLPAVYRDFHRLFVEMEIEPFMLPTHFWPPLIAVGSVGWGIVLLAFWLVLQPPVRQTRPRRRRVRVPQQSKRLCQDYGAAPGADFRWAPAGAAGDPDPPPGGAGGSRAASGNDARMTVGGGSSPGSCGTAPAAGPGFD
jgi:hypothetical protein